MRCPAGCQLERGIDAHGTGGAAETVHRTVADFPPVSCPDVTEAQGMLRRESSTRPARMAPSVMARASPAWMAMNVPLEASPSMPTAKTRIAARTSGRVKPRFMERDHTDRAMFAIILITLHLFF